MANINLLPWRAEERERKNRDFISWLALAFITASAVAFFVWYLFNAVLEDQRQANDLIEAEIGKLDVKLEQIADLEVRREAIISRMKVVQDLQGRRPVPVHVWHDVALAVPEAMYLNSFSRNGEQLSFEGRAANPNIVSNLVSNLDASLWMEGAAVRNIQQQSVSAYGVAKSPMGDNPENSYVSFVVTTRIVSELPEIDQDLEGEVLVNTSNPNSTNAVMNELTDNDIPNNDIPNNDVANTGVNPDQNSEQIDANTGEDQLGSVTDATSDYEINADDSSSADANELESNGDISPNNISPNSSNTGDITLGDGESEMLNNDSISEDPNTEAQASGGLT